MHLEREFLAKDTNLGASYRVMVGEVGKVTERWSSRES